MKKKSILFIVVFLATVLPSVGQTAKIDGLKYRVLSGSTAELYDGKSIKGYVTIPSSVQIKGKNYKVVRIGTYCFYQGYESKKRNYLRGVSIPETIETIGAGAFHECLSLESVQIPNSVIAIEEFAFSHGALNTISLPNTLRFIGAAAFYGCKLKEIVIPNSVTAIGTNAFGYCHNLMKIVVPDHSVKSIYPMDSGNRKWFSGSIFESSRSINDVCGHTIPYPEYIYNELPYDCPFVEKRLPIIKKSFSYYVYDKLINRVNEWQRKKEYETTTQWKERVTEETRRKKVTEMIEQIRAEYIAEYAPQSIEGELGGFDADYSAYPVLIHGFNTFYAQIPLDDAPIFKEKWAQVIMQPQYGIVNDQLGILSCTFKLEDKTYRSTKSYPNDNSADLILNLPPLEIKLGESLEQISNNGTPSVRFVADNSVDRNIPKATVINSKTFAVIIGNENYQRVSKVSYALNDAKIFANYCQKTLGIPVNNIRYYNDATYGIMLSALKDIKSIADSYSGNINVIFYYAGHGLPNETGRSTYLLPIDTDGSQTEVCLATNRLYQILNDLHARSVIIFMDACFSGSQRGDGMLASARGVALKVKTDVPQGNVVVFSAASGDETAFPYKEKGHGMFTYFLLKKLQETKGQVTLGELEDYIATNVGQQSVVINRKKQTPTVISSTSMGESWKTMMLK